MEFQTPYVMDISAAENQMMATQGKLLWRYTVKRKQKQILVETTTTAQDWDA